MKPCLICHKQNENDAPHCPACGEASWGESVVVNKPGSVGMSVEPEGFTDEVLDDTEPEPPKPQPQRKRSKKRGRR